MNETIYHNLLKIFQCDICKSELVTFFTTEIQMKVVEERAICKCSIWEQKK